ncbi:MAG: PucR family transcriptional regulator [Solirubrobacteraceae bacterium]
MGEVTGAEPRTSGRVFVASLQAARKQARSASEVQARLEHIADMLVARRDALALEIVRQVKAEIPEYNSPPSESIEHISAHIDLLAAMVRGRTVQAREFDFITPHAARRASDGVALSTFLHAFRVGIRVLWDTVVADTGEDVRARAATLSAASPFLETLNAASTRSAAAYMDARQSQMAEGAGARRDLLEQLLAGRVPSSPRLRGLAAEAGLGESSPCAVIVAADAGPLAPEAALAAVSDLVKAAASSIRPLNVTRHDELVIIRSLRAGELPALAHSLRAAQADLAARGIAVRVGVSTAHDGLATIPAAYAEARGALEGVGEQGGVVALAELSPSDYLASHADDVAPRLIREPVRRFIAEDLERDGALIATVLAYAAADMNLAKTAKRLHVHVNTARYRLSRIAERTSCDPRSVADMLDLLLAIKLLGGPRAGAVTG